MTSQDTKQCPCRKCIDARGGMSIFNQWMVLCPICGNKRCPHANDHNNACTNSNEPGQPGSAYEDQKPYLPCATEDLPTVLKQLEDWNAKPK